MDIRGIVFGAGTYGRLLKIGLENYYKMKIVAICDNDRNIWGEYIDNILIIAPQQLLAMSFDKILL